MILMRNLIEILVVNLMIFGLRQRDGEEACRGNTFCQCHPELAEGLFVNK